MSDPKLDLLAEVALQALHKWEEATKKMAEEHSATGSVSEETLQKVTVAFDAYMRSLGAAGVS